MATPVGPHQGFPTTPDAPRSAHLAKAQGASLSRDPIPLGECGLLTRKNAMRYCGQLGDERFDREVALRCRPRFIGQERFYLRQDLDA